MPKERVTDIVEKLALPILAEAALELVDVEYKKEGTNWFLRVFIDKPGGVDIDDCSRVSERLSDLLDEADPIPTAYFLEVSSPGAERPLKKPADYQNSIGQYVHVSLYEPISGLKTFEGMLTSFENDALFLEYNRKGVRQTVQIPFAKVASARLAIEF